MDGYKATLSAEHPAFEVARLLIANGYGLGKVSGFAMEEIDSNCPGITLLIPDPNLKPSRFPMSIFWYIFGKPPRRLDIGTIWFDSRLFKNCDWLFEVNGRQYLPQLKELADVISRKFEKRVVLTLTRETPDTECFGSDWD